MLPKSKIYTREFLGRSYLSPSLAAFYVEGKGMDDYVSFALREVAASFGNRCAENKSRLILLPASGGL